MIGGQSNTCAIPRRPADIDAATFRAITQRTDVTAVRIRDEDHGTELRARLEVTGREDLPHSAFVKLAPVRPAERLFNRFMNLARNEADVYRLLGHDLADIVPTVYGAKDRHRGRAVVIMEDLADRGARFVPLSAGATAAEALLVARMLGSLHHRFWMSDRLIDGDLARFGPSRSRTTRVGPHSWHLLRTVPRSFDDIVPPDFRRRATMLIEHRWAIARLMQTHPHAMIHGDTHLGNMCFVGGDPVLFDWQVAACGPAVKDLSYFACTSIPTDTRRAIDDDASKARNQPARDCITPSRESATSTASNCLRNDFRSRRRTRWRRTTFPSPRIDLAPAPKRRHRCGYDRR